MSSTDRQCPEQESNQIADGTGDDLTQCYIALIDTQGPIDTDALRRLILLRGLPIDANALDTPSFGRCSLRGLLWKALLGVGLIDADEYATLVTSGPSVDDSRVREDARRTFAKSDDFNTRVPTDKIIRLLNAYVRCRGNVRGIYAQSMSLLAAPFLYVMPEPDAFHCFRTFLDAKVSTYVQRYSGARSACALLDRCVESVLPELHSVLAEHSLYAEVYAFPVMSSLGMCVRPLCDTVRLWDIILAFGIHLHIVFTLARLAIRGDHLVNAARTSGTAPLSTRELEQGFGLSAETVLAKGVALTAQLEAGLYSELLAHADSASVPVSKHSESSTACHQQEPDEIEQNRIDFPSISSNNPNVEISHQVWKENDMTGLVGADNRIQWQRSGALDESPDGCENSQRSAPSSSGSGESKRLDRHGIRASFAEVKEYGTKQPRP